LSTQKRFIVLLALALLPACLTSSVPPTDQALILEDVYLTMTRYYANFDGRPDFDQAYAEVQAELEGGDVPESAFFNIVVDLLSSLEDPHIRLNAPFREFLTFDRLGHERNVDVDLLKAQYLSGTVENRRVLYGQLRENIGYLYLPDLRDWTEIGQLPFETEEALRALQPTRALVLDLRNNDGGSALYAQALAGVFTQERFLWHVTQNKRGPSPDDFDAPYPWYVDPFSGLSYDKPIIVLTGRYTISAGERLVMALRRLPQVTVLGTETAGTQGSVMGREMGNGWTYTLTFERVLDPEGMNFDYTGIPPDVYIGTPRSAFPDGVDPILEAALDRLLHATADA